MNQFERLKQNLRGYVSRFYLNQVLKGSLVTLFAGGVLWLLIALLEYAGNFEELTRAILFFSFLALFTGFLVTQVLLPLARMIGILKPKDDNQAAGEIGRSLKPVEDKLLNLLNLERQHEGSSNKLIIASLDQKASTLNRFDFAQVIDFRKSALWLRYLAIPVGLAALILFWNPAMLSESSKRVVQFDRSFVPPAPFSFQVDNASMSVAEGEDFELQVSVNGTALPEHVFVEVDDARFRMKKLSTGSFGFVFEDVRAPITFSLSAAEVGSEDYRIEVLPFPKLLRSRAHINYPDYTGLKDEELLNRSQLKLPEGSTIQWAFDLKNVESASLVSAVMTEPLEQNEGMFAVEKTVRQDEEFILSMQNESGLADSAMLSLFAISDAAPGIQAREMYDSTASGLRYFNGKIMDDYGFQSLYFHASVLKDGAIAQSIKERVAITPHNTEQPFSFLFSLDSFDLDPEQSIEYYFEVWDNDAVNGSKPARTIVWKYEVPSESELKDKNDQESQKTKDALESELDELKKLEREFEEFRKEVLQKKKPDWQDKERMKEMLEKQKRTMEKLMERAQEQRKQNEFNNKFNEYSEQLMEKQQQVQEMFDELFDEEFKEKYDEYQKLLEEMNKQQMLQKMEEMTLDNEQLEKQLDRTLELFKQLEFEQKLEETISKSEELAEKQEELREKTEDKSNSEQELEKEQEELSEELNELNEELEKLDELNQALEEPTPLPKPDQEMQDAKEGMEESKEQLQKENRKKSKEGQKKAEDALKKASESLNSFQQDQAQEQASENMDDMRQLLENLVDLSHSQESIMEALKGLSGHDPKYVATAKRQKDLIDDTKVVEDSLLALSKRVPMISKQINDEISWVKQNMSKGLENMTNQPPNQGKRYREMATVNQQLAMTSLNNLANMFDDIIRNMQQEMNSNMSGSGQCNKPGGSNSGKPSAGDLKKMQQRLNEQIKKMKEALEKGENPGGKKPGDKPGSLGAGGMSKELARMAAEQAAIREQLRQMSQSLEQEGEGGKPGTQMKELQKMMEETEEDILYQNITQETLKRQQEILTKLLESEKAERERELDEKRESKSATQEYEIPDDIWEQYQREKEKEIELYKTLPPNLKPYYRKQVNRYFSEFAE